MFAVVQCEILNNCKEMGPLVTVDWEEAAILTGEGIRTDIDLGLDQYSTRNLRVLGQAD